MLKYIVRRLLLLPLILLGVSVFIIMLVHALPGDPCSSIMGERTTEAGLAACRHGLGLDRPVYEQYFDYMAGLSRGDLGTSATNRVPVLDSFLTRFPATIELALAAILVAIGVGVPLGVAAAKRQGLLVDNLVTVLSLVGISIRSSSLACSSHTSSASGCTGCRRPAGSPSGTTTSPGPARTSCCGSRS